MTRFLLSLAVCFSLLGCSGSKDKDGANTAKAPTDRYRIAVIPKGLTHEHWQSVERGAKAAAKDLEAKVGKPIEILWDGPRKEDDAKEQIDLVDQKVKMGLHALCLAPQHSKQMVGPVRRSVENKVAVVILDSDLDDKDLYVKYVATDNYNGGVLSAQYLLKRLDKKGVKEPNLILFRYQPGSESTEQREKGFLDQIEKERKNGRTIHLISDNIYAGATVDTAKDAAGPLLRSLSGKGIDGIFAVNESSTAGMLAALRGNQAVKDRALLMGFDMSGPLLKALREKEVIGLLVQNPYRMGYLGVWNAVQHLEGYDVGAGGKSQSTGELVLTADKDDVDGKTYLHVDEDRAVQLYDKNRQSEQKLDLPEYKKRP
jgi:ribose transport system substrate-binding protein